MDSIGDDIAAVMLTHVDYRTGRLHDMQAITEKAHAAGAVMIWDLAHSAGALPVNMFEIKAEFAIGCTYKYLNGGPGSVAGCFVHERHHRRQDLPRLAGWWGQDKENRFQMGPDFQPIPSAEGWQLSNAPILSMAALRAALDIFDEVGMDAIRQKSMALTGYFESLLREHADRLSIEVITPADPAQRGAQLSLLTGSDGRQLFDQLTQAGVIVDWREPNVIRAAPAPLYNTFEDVWRFVQALLGKA